jgi:hypothetical protein
MPYIATAIFDQEFNSGSYSSKSGKMSRPFQACSDPKGNFGRNQLRDVPQSHLALRNEQQKFHSFEEIGKRNQSAIPSMVLGERQSEDRLGLE